MSKIVDMKSASQNTALSLGTPEFWKGRSVFLTGHTGFKGSWLSVVLSHFGAEVHGYSLAAPTEPSLFEEAQVESLLASSTIGDIRDRAKLEDSLQASKADVLFHLAAQPMVLRSYEDPFETYEINVSGTVAVLDAARRLESLRGLVVITTDKCYENREWQWPYRESDTLGGFDPYSNSKACCELVVDSFRRSFFLSDAKQKEVGIASARAGNIIGGGDWGEYRLLPDYFRALHKGSSMTIRRPHAVRPWQHVLEALSGYLMLAEAVAQKPKEYSQGWNFGPDQSLVRKVLQVIEALQSHTSSPIEIVVDPSSSAGHEANMLRLDCSKSSGSLGWVPRLTFEQSIAYTGSWYEQWMKGASAIELMNRQIAEYFAVAAEKGSENLAEVG